MAAGKSYLSYSINFTTPRRIRAELYIDGSSHELQEQRWNELYTQRAAIETAFGVDPPSLSFEPLPNSRASRIAVYHEGAVEQEDEWPAYQAWMVASLSRLRSAVQPFVDGISE